jgi:hypothetical protein
LISSVAVSRSVAVPVVITGRPALSSDVLTTRTGAAAETVAGSSCAGVAVRP